MPHFKEDEKGRVEYPVILAIIEYIDNFVVIFFTFEYFIRLLVSPRRFKFIKVKEFSLNLRVTLEQVTLLINYRNKICFI